MMHTLYKGLDGSNPLGFMASIGLLHLLAIQGIHARLAFTEDGGLHACITCDLTRDDIVDIIAKDAEVSEGPQPWRLTYEKMEKNGIKVVADLKAPPDQFRGFLDSAINEWLAGRSEQADYAAAFGTDVAVDGNGNTKPTAFHFTAAQQQFLGAIEASRGKINSAWVEASLDGREERTKPGSNLRWDPDAERNRALMGVNPTDGGTTVNAPLEWLAFRGLPAFPCLPVGKRVVTTGVTGHRQTELRFHWPLWSCGASYATVRSLLFLTAGWIVKEEQIRRKIETEAGRGPRRRTMERLQDELENVFGERRLRSVFAVCTSEIRRTAQGFGNFGPADIHA